MRRFLTILACFTATAALAVAGPSRGPSVLVETRLGARQDQTVSIVLNGAGGRQPRLAIPDFILASEDAELRAATGTLADVLWHDLEFEEEFYMIPPEEARKIPAAASAEGLPIAQWTALGADFVLLASAKRAGADLSVDVHVIAVSGDALRKDVFASRFSPCQVAEVRTCAHTIANSLHKQLRNVEGVAMTRLAFVSDRGSAHVPGDIDRSGKEIYIADYDGANPQPVTANHALNISPTWSPDGRLLAWVSFAGRNSDVYVKSIYEVRQWRPAGGTDAISNLFPVFSPDGTQIAFASNRDGSYQIYVVDAQGRTPPRRLTAGRASEGVPTWSHTGAQIAFTSDRLGENTPRLFIMNADGTNPMVVPDTPRADRPSWSPLGDKIAFTCGSTQPYNICAFDIHTNQVRPLRAPDGFSSEQPVFSANGRHIAFKTNRWGKEQIAIMDTKGNIQRQVTSTGDNTFPAWSRSKG